MYEFYTSREYVSLSWLAKLYYSDYQGFISGEILDDEDASDWAKNFYLAYCFCALGIPVILSFCIDQSTYSERKNAESKFYTKHSNPSRHVV